MCEVNEYFELIKKCAEENGVYLTENSIKIANFRKRANIPMNICPCAKEDKERGCISEKCMKEIQEKGLCHCKCYSKINNL